MTASSERDGAARRRAPGIRAKLLAALAAIAATTLIATAVAFVSFGRGGASLGRIAADGIGAMQGALVLARQSAEIVGTAPAMLGADTDAAVAAVVADLDGDRRAMAAQLDVLAAGALGAAAVAPARAAA